jgi:hypothetical protein
MRVIGVKTTVPFFHGSCASRVLMATSTRPISIRALDERRGQPFVGHRRTATTRRSQARSLVLAPQRRARGGGVDGGLAPNRTNGWP